MKFRVYYLRAFRENNVKSFVVLRVLSYRTFIGRKSSIDCIFAYLLRTHRARSKLLEVSFEKEIKI